jgi:hypothetical protein
VKLTTKQLKQIILEELNFILETENESMVSSEEIQKVENMLYNEDDLELIIQGLELAEVSGIPVDYQLLLINKSQNFLKDLARSPGGREMKELLHHIAKVATHLTTQISIAKNKKALPETLEILARIKGTNGKNIAALVAKNPSAPVYLLDELSMHHYWAVRATVAARDRTPIETLQRLMSDSNEMVRTTAKSNIDRRKEL